ncbi:MAG: hypothetical protein DRP35_02070 [Candidatus Zixiibacteriota bacterium]|nr:MAG: hypothetical protein DRP35_02070 [candidate division Zixibacteria bacterium]
MRRFSIVTFLTLFFISAISFTVFAGVEEVTPENQVSDFSENNLKNLILNQSSSNKLSQKSQTLTLPATLDKNTNISGTEDQVFTPLDILTSTLQGGDNIGSAVAIGTMPYSTTGTTVGYTDDYQITCELTTLSGPDVVYSYSPAIDENVDISLCASLDAVNVWVYENDVSTMVACNRFATACGSPRAELLDVPMYTGNIYYIVVCADYQLSSSGGSYQIDCSASEMPVLHDSSLVHPIISVGSDGYAMIAYEENIFDTTQLWFGSDDDLVTLPAGASWQGNNKYPSCAYWGDTVFYGTYTDEGTADIHLIEFAHPTNNALWSNSYWDFSSYGWHDIKMANIATNNSQPFAEQPGYRFGLVSIIHSTTYTAIPIVDGPFILYEIDGPDVGSANISWYDELYGCQGTSNIIDPITLYHYAVYDPYSTADAQRQLFIRMDNFDDMDDEINSGGWTYGLDPGEHIQYPEVASNDGNIVVISEYYSDTAPTDRDIICWTASLGDAGNLISSVVVATTDDERFPRVKHVSGSMFVCTYITNNILYMTVSEDNGANWGTPVSVSDADEVVSEYHASDISEKGAKIIWEYRVAGDPDTSIYLHFASTDLIADTDSDGIADDIDNCIDIANPLQEDADADGIGDVCDDCTDIDGDGYGDPGYAANTCTEDNCPSIFNDAQLDADADGIGDDCDDCTDTDSDGYGNPSYVANTCTIDNCPTTNNPGQEDTDSDGIGDACCCIDIRGDVNGDDAIGIADVTFLVDYIFNSGPVPPCPAEADVDASNGGVPVGISDLTSLVDYMFNGGALPQTCP